MSDNHNDTSQTTIQIILPAVSEDAVSEMLRAITREIAAHNPDAVAHGLLGGDDGYGGNWTSAVFEMRPFWWGDCTCGADDAEEERPHTPECAFELPNFLHRQSGMRVSWYKYIGRGMEVENCPADLGVVMEECIRDVRISQ